MRIAIALSCSCTGTVGSCIERNSEARIFAIWGWQVPVPSKSLGYEGSSRGTQGRFNSAALDSVLREH